MKDMDSSDLKNLALFVNNDCWQRINTYFSKPNMDYNLAEFIPREIKNYFKRYKIKDYEFIDFCNIDLDLLKQFCNLIIKHRLQISWSAAAIVNPNMKEADFIKMREAGCRKIIFEIITGSDKLLKKMGLSFNTKDISSLLYLAHQNDISVGINLILGFPFETDEDYNETVSFLIRHTPAIDEITKITYCLCNFFRKEAFPVTFSFCRYWKRCLSLKQDNDISLSKSDYKSYLSGISKPGIPVMNIEPSFHILDYIRDLVASRSLKRKGLSFLFDNGKGRLFWKGRELTKGFGLYTSIFSYGFWQDTEHADWQIKKVSEEKMILKGQWQTLPIIQVWEIELREDMRIAWRIEMEVLEELIIEGEEQTNVMLTDEYEAWFNRDGSCGSFSNSFNEEWVILFEKEASKIKSIGIRDAADRLPSVLLKSNNLNNDYYLSILNTSSYFSARKLKCYKIKKTDKRYLPGKYLYFDGEIKIAP